MKAPKKDTLSKFPSKGSRKVRGWRVPMARGRKTREVESPERLLVDRLLGDEFRRSRGEVGSNNKREKRRFEISRMMTEGIWSGHAERRVPEVKSSAMRRAMCRPCNGAKSNDGMEFRATIRRVGKVGSRYRRVLAVMENSGSPPLPVASRLHLLPVFNTGYLKCWTNYSFIYYPYLSIYPHALNPPSPSSSSQPDGPNLQSDTPPHPTPRSPPWYSHDTSRSFSRDSQTACAVHTSTPRGFALRGD